MANMKPALIAVLTVVLSSVDSFNIAYYRPPTTSKATLSIATVLHGEGTGGWGIGGSREMVPEEFAKGGEGRFFEGYKLQDRGEFMRKVSRDKQELKKDEMDELLGVAEIAGLKVKDPSERLNKFAPDLLDDEDIDLSWGGNVDTFERPASSITRMDEDTGSSGVW
jgi:hypothetical protein